VELFKSSFVVYMYPSLLDQRSCSYDRITCSVLFARWFGGFGILLKVGTALVIRD
jgi:hypothetical protein